MSQFMWGMLTMASLVSSLFLARFYVDSRDRLFAIFAVAFAVLAMHWTLLAAVPAASDSRPLAYLPRLVAFGLIFVAIVDKNRRG